MQIVEGKEQDYKAWFDKNDDPYGRRCFTYAEAWAERLEAQIAVDGDAATTIQKYADAFSREVDTDGITGFMYNMAVQILAVCWVHGDLLRRWHNREVQFGNEGDKANETDGVLNSALLRVGLK